MSKLTKFLKSPTAQLALTYLLIILIMSIVFSIVIYATSSHEFNRPAPPDSFFNNLNNMSNQSPRVNEFLRQRAAEARDALAMRLVILNGLVLIGGAVLSYFLARRSLAPIEAAMAAQSQFISDASHELRTPLTAIQTSNEVALRKPHLTAAEARHLIEHNTIDIKRLKDLSDGLLNLARQESAPLKLLRVNLQDVVADALNQVINQAAAKEISVDDQVANVAVRADPAALTRVLVILLDNAIKYSPDGSTVTLTSSTKGKQAIIAVSDHGTGIRASDLPHIFRRFYRADNARTNNAAHGYGLGLAIAEQIMHSNQGTISVTSEPGKGSSFVIKLNLA